MGERKSRCPDMKNMALKDSISGLLKEIGSSMTVEKARKILKHVLTNADTYIVVDKAMAAENANSVSFANAKNVKPVSSKKLPEKLSETDSSSAESEKNGSDNSSDCRDGSFKGNDTSGKSETSVEEEHIASGSQPTSESSETSGEISDESDDLPDPRLFMCDQSPDEKSGKVNENKTKKGIPSVDSKAWSESTSSKKSTKRKSHCPSVLPAKPSKTPRLKESSSAETTREEKRPKFFPSKPLDQSSKPEKIIQEIISKRSNESKVVQAKRTPNSECPKSEINVKAPKDDVPVVIEETSLEDYGERPAKKVETPGKNLDYHVIDVEDYDSNANCASEPTGQLSSLPKTNASGDKKAKRSELDDAVAKCSAAVEILVESRKQVSIDTDSDSEPASCSKETAESSSGVDPKGKKRSSGNHNSKAGSSKRPRSSPKKTIQWTRAHDREILVVCQKLGPTDEAFKEASKNLGIKNYQVVKKRFDVLMEVVQKIINKKIFT